MKDYEERMGWFNEARFGMFIHFGLYSILERGEWVMFNERIPKEEYARLADRFNPSGFNPDQWVSLAEKSGMKYMVLGTRHHEGFCLFDSKVSTFSSVETSAKRDFVAEYVKACRKRGMRIGFYYSLLDWRFPGYFNRERYPQSFKEVVEQAHAQVKELMTNYGRIDYLWYDGEWISGVELKRGLIEQGESPQIARLWRSEELNEMVRKLQPQIILNNRAGLEEDVDTPEQYVVPSKEGRCWESCMTIGDCWGYVKHNPNLKSTTQLIQYLVYCANGGGNYLLNVGPRPDGTIREEETERLSEIGEWMKNNGESIYGSQRPPANFGSSIMGIVTTKGNKAYFHVFRWSGKEAVLVGVKNKVISGALLKTKEKVKVKQNHLGKVFIKGLPEEPPDRYDSVILLELDSKPQPFSYEGIPL